MYSGFITSKRIVPAVGVHQRFNAASYRMIAPYFAEGTFPTLKQLMHFEGMNGPDGLKVKSPGHHDPGHLYNPETGAGDIPRLITDHYRNLVSALRSKDLVRAGFDAAWLAHYICDGLTPAHHFPLNENVAKQSEHSKRIPKRYKYTVIVPGINFFDTIRRSWAVWGGKGLLTTHFNFEVGVAAALVGFRLKADLNHEQLAKARSVSLLPFFKSEAQSIAELEMYKSFYVSGWNSELARMVKNRLAPQIVQTIAIAWLLAYLEAGLESAKLAQPRRSKKR
ncbi:MAG TPA: hypothetical protein VF272_02585 [Candidatus Saccharimonadia bacterium]